MYRIQSRMHVTLIKSPVKIGATKIIFVLLHVMLTRLYGGFYEVLTSFCESIIIAINYVVNVNH